MTRSTICVGSLLLLLCFLSAPTALAQVNMPDPTTIAGMAIPAPELPDGTVSVRVVREQLGNNVAGQRVKVAAGTSTKTGVTDESGRTQITGLTAGASAVAEAVVDSETVTSKPFQVPSKGGIRVILISGLQNVIERRKQDAAVAAAAPPAKGIVVIGGESRIDMEFEGDSLTVFYILEILNTARTRVDIGGPLVIDLPRGASGAALVDGSSPSATVRGSHVTIVGPFAPGTTTVQVAFTLPHDSANLTLTQKWPAALEKVTVVVEKVGDVHISSPQFTSHGDVRADNGTPYIMGTGQGLAAGGTLTVQLSGLPVHPMWPRYTALIFALLIIGAGVWLASGRSRVDEQRLRLTARRESLYAELVKIEEQHRSGRVDTPRYHSRRAQLVTELEHIYGELDNSGGGEAAA
jgi:hypothetical protein